MIRAGELDRSLYLISKGQLEVLLQAEDGRLRRLTAYGPNSVVGEIAFIDGHPRTATIRGVSDGEVLRLSFDAFEVLAARHPELGRAILLDLARILAAKLRQMSEAFVEGAVAG